MNFDLQYTIQVLSASALFAAFFYVFLRQTTFFRLNRFYLIGTMLGAVLIPFMKIPEAIPAILPADVPTLSVLLDEVTIGEIVKQSINWTLMAYATVTFVLVLRVVTGFVSALRLTNKAKKHKINALEVCVTDDNINPFSFFKRILINRELLDNKGELLQILKHERTHVKQGHSYDVLLTELLCALFWFNPFFWLLKKELKSTHEYLADENVLEQDADLAGYFMLIFNNLVGRQVGMTNNFNHSLNFKRMKMMKKKRSSGMAKFLSVAALPVLFMSALFFSGQVYSKSELPIEVGQQDTVWAFDGKTKQTEKSKDDLQEIVVVGFGTSDEKPKQSQAGKSSDNQTKEAQTVKEEDMVFMVVEKMPKYPGGQDALIKFLMQNVKYPTEAQEKRIQGRVYVEFVIDKKGKIKNIEILKGVDPLLDEEAMRVVRSMPDWEPGTQRGKLVNVSYRLPINFALRDAKK